MSTFCSLCFIFWGRICCFIFCWVVFGIYFFMKSLLMWVVVSTGSMSIGLNLLDNGIGSFIRAFLFRLDFSFSLLRVFPPDFGCVSHIHHNPPPKKTQVCYFFKSVNLIFIKKITHFYS